jgi:hypothetical protein
MNQSRSEYVVAITWREKQISTLLCDRIHDDYIAAIPSKKRNKLPHICAPTTIRPGLAEWIAGVIERGGYQPIIQSWHFRPRLL